MLQNFRQLQVAASFELRQTRIIVVPCGDASGGQALRRVELGGEFLVAETGIKRAKIKRRRSAGKMISNLKIA